MGGLRGSHSVSRMARKLAIDSENSTDLRLGQMTAGWKELNWAKRRAMMMASQLAECSE